MITGRDRHPYGKSLSLSEKSPSPRACGERLGEGMVMSIR